MAEAKAEVMEEIEDGRDEGEEEDSVDPASVRPGEQALGGAGCPRPRLVWEEAWEVQDSSVSPQLRSVGSHTTGYVRQQAGQGKAAGPVGQIASIFRRDQSLGFHMRSSSFRSW